MSCLKIEVVEQETGDLDPTANFRLILIQTELERVKYLVRAYLRARLAKVRYYLADDQNKAIESVINKKLKRMKTKMKIVTLTLRFP